MFSKNCFNVFLKIFLVTGGYDASKKGLMTTEILEDKQWKVLPYGDLPGNIGLRGVRLATVGNKVFSFGNVLNDNIYYSLTNFYFLRWFAGSKQRKSNLLNLRVQH